MKGVDKILKWIIKHTETGVTLFQFNCTETMSSVHVKYQPQGFGSKYEESLQYAW